MHADMVPQRTTHVVGGGEGASKLGKGDRRILDVSWWWDPVHTWGPPLHRFSSTGSSVLPRDPTDLVYFVH